MISDMEKWAVLQVTKIKKTITYAFNIGLHAELKYYKRRSERLSNFILVF